MDVWTLQESTATEYFVNETVGLNPEEATDRCKNLGGSLVSILSQTTQDFISELFSSINITTTKYFWIDATRINGTWQWTDSTSLNYSNWFEPEEVNNTGEECAAIWPNHHLKWLSVPCVDDNLGLICERKIPVTFSQQATTQVISTIVTSTTNPAPTTKAFEYPTTAKPNLNATTQMSSQTNSILMPPQQQTINLYVQIVVPLVMLAILVNVIAAVMMIRRKRREKSWRLNQETTFFHQPQQNSLENLEISLENESDADSLPEFIINPKQSSVFSNVTYESVPRRLREPSSNSNQNDDSAYVDVYSFSQKNKTFV